MTTCVMKGKVLSVQCSNYDKMLDLTSCRDRAKVCTVEVDIASA
jgi:hypothetical protein